MVKRRRKGEESTKKGRRDEREKNKAMGHIKTI